MPVQVMPGIEFEYERVIDLGRSPYFAIDAEEKEEEEHEKVPSVDLHSSANTDIAS